MPDEEVTSPRDISIQFIGSRPGEKIHEELWSDQESLGETANPKIRRLSRLPVDPDWLATQLGELEALAEDGDTLEVVGKLGAMVREPQRVDLPNLSDTGSYRAVGEAAVKPPVD
jgi:FlaA1/EpsC-like NDP-sugar epimerase